MQIPEEGITVFGNVLHTHLAGNIYNSYQCTVSHACHLNHVIFIIGVSLILRHLRPDPSCGNGYRELKPLDQNLEYDFNFQEIKALPQTVKVLPVSLY